MKVLFIGGSGNISSASSELAIKQGIDLYHLNRGNRELPAGVKSLIADITNTQQVVEVLHKHNWDVVVNWIAFNTNDIERDFKLFNGKTKHYIFISTASAYQKTHSHYIITESTPLKNDIWEYSQNKIACEEMLMKLYRENNFPVTIVRPSHTYNTVIPVAIAGWTDYNVVDRMKRGKSVVIHGDGTSLWTLTHASDFALGFNGLLGNTQSLGEAYHITSDEVLTWNQIYQQLADAVGCKANFVHIASEQIVRFAEQINGPNLKGTLLGDKSHSAVFDNSKIKKLVPSFHATIPFFSGIKNTLKWFETKPERIKINLAMEVFLDRLTERYG